MMFTVGPLGLFSAISYGVASFTFAFGAVHKGLIGKDKMAIDYCFYVACISTVTGLVSAVLCAMDFRDRTSIKSDYILLN